MSLPHLDRECQTIVRDAEVIAREYGLEYVGTEHILLALLRRDGCTAARTLQALGVTTERARGELARLLARDKEDTWVFGRLPGTPHYRNVIALAIEEATRDGAAEIASEHLLLGLLRETGSTAERILRTFGVSAERCRQELHRQRGG